MAQMEQKSLTEGQAKGPADSVTLSASPEHESVALRSFGSVLEFRISKPEVSEKLPQG